MKESRIEMLVRKGDSGGGFTLQELPSSLLYSSYRPVRLPAGEYEESVDVSVVDGKKNYILKAQTGTRYISLSEREYYLWELMDGNRDIKALISACYFEFGRLDFSWVKTFIGSLQEAGLIRLIPVSSLVVMDKPGGGVAERLKAVLSSLEVRVDDADGWVGRMYSNGGYILVVNYMFVFYIVLSLAGFIEYDRLYLTDKFPFWMLAGRFFDERSWFSVAAIIASFIFVPSVHELFHALACKKYGRKVAAFGFTLLDRFYPTFYTDVTDIYLATRSERLFVSLAGPLSTFALAALYFIPIFFFPNSHWAVVLFHLGRVILLIGAISMYPFFLLKMDGYYILVDLLGVPGLREKTYSLIKNIPGYVMSATKPSRAELLMMLYFLICLASIAYAVVYLVV